MEPKWSVHIPRKVWLTVVLVLLGVLLAAQNSTVVFPNMTAHVIVTEGQSHRLTEALDGRGVRPLGESEAARP